LDTKDIPKTMPSPWVPISSPILIAIIGKTLEELGELISALGRMLIQGVQGVDPKTGKTNTQMVTEEIADVNAKTAELVDELGLDTEEIHKRSLAKVAFSGSWFNWIRRGMPDGEIKE
jgi:hypothetical protein